MDSLPTWAVSIIAVAIGLSPGICAPCGSPDRSISAPQTAGAVEPAAAQKVSQGELNSKPIKERGNGHAFGSVLAVRSEALAEGGSEPRCQAGRYGRHRGPSVVITGTIRHGR
jgi:hypothetical protein